MARQRGELVPIGDAFSGMGGSVKAIREASPQALHHFTQADQVNQLVTASEADPNLGFMARMMALCSLPRTNPRRPERVQACQRPLHALHDCRWRKQTPLRKPSPIATGLALDRSGTDPKPRTGSRPLALRLHADSGGLQQRWGCANPAPQSNEPAVQQVYRQFGVDPAEASDNQTVQDFPVQADESGPLPKLGHECHRHLEHRLHERRHRTAAGRGEDRPRHRSRPSVACPLRARQSLR